MRKETFVADEQIVRLAINTPKNHAAAGYWQSRAALRLARWAMRVSSVSILGTVAAYLGSARATCSAKRNEQNILLVAALTYATTDGSRPVKPVALAWLSTMKITVLSA